MAASVRELTSSLVKIFRKCTFTVFTLIKSVLEIHQLAKIRLLFTHVTGGLQQHQVPMISLAVSHAQHAPSLALSVAFNRGNQGRQLPRSGA